MFATFQRLGVSVFASDRAVIRAALRKLKPVSRRGRRDRTARHAFLREMLEHQRKARALVVRFRL